MSKTRITILASAVASFAMIGASAAEAETIPARLVSDLQEDFGFADFQAAGVAGNLARETGNFRYLQEISPLVDGSRGGLGYAQWTASRREAFEAWAGERDLTEYETNYGFLQHELKGDYSNVVDRVLETGSAEEAAVVFMDGYLRPHPQYEHIEERVAYAEAYLDEDFTGAGCQAYHEVEVSGRMMVVSLCPDPVPQVERPPLGWAFAEADVAEFNHLESDVQAVLADLLSYGPLPSEREVPVAMSASHTVETRASYVSAPREKIYGLLEIK
ncbi:phage tail tip lysozyme [Sulfitobacter sp. 1A13353]|uniref:phage tail tip lysozyme n=1 Tax=Sulfitobacter sp. 1A13353 TaxID=3368568 RepID=UPI0037473CE2